MAALPSLGFKASERVQPRVRFQGGAMAAAGTVALLASVLELSTQRGLLRPFNHPSIDELRRRGPIPRIGVAWAIARRIFATPTTESSTSLQDATGATLPGLSTADDSQRRAAAYKP